MKDENQQILLEGLAADTAAILKKLNNLKLGSEYPDITPLTLELNQIKSELQQLNVIYKASTNDIISKQRLIDLKIQLDRISLKLSREDSLINYYFSPVNTLVKTLAILAIAVFIGMFIDRLYLNYQIRKATKIERNDRNH